MLKSTHRPVASAPTSSLPEQWTEHKAPTGHTYYYNATTKKSTYIRPDDPTRATPAVEDTPAAQPHAGFPHQNSTHNLSARPHQFGFPNGRYQAASVSSNDRNLHFTRPQHRDRPKSKVAIPGSEPWVLVTTRLARRFVHNPETRESHWRFPPEVLKNVIELDRQSREKRLKTEHNPSPEVAPAAESSSSLPPTAALPPATEKQADSENELASDEEYEEVEVTDDDGDSENADALKGEPQENVPVEFDEDDIAYQLRAMGQDYGLDPEEYGDDDAENAEEGAEGLPLTEDDARALFTDLLEDFQVSPFTTWDALIDAGHIIEDDRYVALPNMRSRKEAFAEWSKQKMQEVKEKRASEAKKDPKIPYFEFLEVRATPKLYWPEFRRKYQKEHEMRNTKLSDKDREKWYRDYIKRLSLPEHILKADFIALLKSLPLYTLNRSTTLEALPPEMTTDLRFISLRSSVRNPLIEAHTRTLDPAPQNPELSAEEAQNKMKDKMERDRREKALSERKRLVDQDKKRQEGALRYGKGMLREGEDELERAKRVGKHGLLGHFDAQEPQD